MQRGNKGARKRGREEHLLCPGKWIEGRGRDLGVQKKNREREGGREGRKKGRADSYFSTVKS